MPDVGAGTGGAEVAAAIGTAVVGHDPLDTERLYVVFGYGPSLEVFRIDMCPYRGANGPARPSRATTRRSSGTTRYVGGDHLPSGARGAQRLLQPA
jgi:hypothetical protein